jgi:hypothetical protein
MLKLLDLPANKLRKEPTYKFYRFEVLKAEHKEAKFNEIIINYSISIF